MVASPVGDNTYVTFVAIGETRIKSGELLSYEMVEPEKTDQSQNIVYWIDWCLFRVRY